MNGFCCKMSRNSNRQFKVDSRNKRQTRLFQTAERLLQCMLALLIMQRNGQFVAAFPFCLLDIPLSLTNSK